MKNLLLNLIEEKINENHSEELRQALISEALRFTSDDFLSTLNTMSNSSPNLSWEFSNGLITSIDQKIVDDFDNAISDVHTKSIRELIEFFESHIDNNSQKWLEIFAGVQSYFEIKNFS